MPWSNQGGGPWGSGGSKGPWGSGPQSSGPTPPDLEQLLRRSQDRLKNVLPGGNLGGRGFALLTLGAIVLWGVSGFFRVEPDELGVVLRFGKHVREVQPGLNYHLPYPIETVLTPKALRVNKIDVGMRVVDDARRGTTVRDVPEESLMLTGDENIVDVDFSVLWKVQPAKVRDYLFNIQNPEGTVKAVAESAMREVVGRSNIQPILTGARQNIESAVQDLMQKTLDQYGAGILIQQVQLQKVDPPAQVIDSFRDVQAARADLERAQNEAQTYANRVVPEARGRVAQITQNAEAYREQTVAEAHRPDRAVLQDLRRIQEGAGRDPPAHVPRDDGAAVRRHRQDHPRYRRRRPGRRRGAVPAAQRTRAASARGGRCPMKLGIVGGALVVVLIVAAILGYSSMFTVYETQQALVVRLGQPVRGITEPGLNFKVPLIDSVITIDKRILDLESPAQEVIASDQKRLVVDAFARYKIKDPLRFYQTLGSIAGANSQLAILLNSALRRVLGEVTLHRCGSRPARRS